ncbi:MAG: hypothetical protein GEV03_08800 [Streptosporangiales bacterium]|nr:hypothetical protein [Streptosporangiales bacterium]
MREDPRMRIAVVGGGPGGLFFAVFARLARPDWQVTVWERDSAQSSGFGLVLPRRALETLRQRDPDLSHRLDSRMVWWENVLIRHNGGSVSIAGPPYSSISRALLLSELRVRCQELQVQIRTGQAAPDSPELARTHELVVAADGANSLVRSAHQRSFGSTPKVGRSRYAWLCMGEQLDAFQFYTLERSGNVIQIHSYPHATDASTVIIEMREEAWRRLSLASDGTDAFGESSVQFCQQILTDAFGKVPLLAHSRSWRRFVSVSAESWTTRNVVLMGDAAHAMHFSTGSGTKLAMDDALVLVDCLAGEAGIESALQAYQNRRYPTVSEFARAAEASRVWFEEIDAYRDKHISEFALSLLIRSGRISAERLRWAGMQALRDTDEPGFRRARVELGVFAEPRRIS